MNSSFHNSAWIQSYRENHERKLSTSSLLSRNNSKRHTNHEAFFHENYYCGRWTERGRNVQELVNRFLPLQWWHRQVVLATLLLKHFFGPSYRLVIGEFHTVFATLHVGWSLTCFSMVQQSCVIVCFAKKRKKKSTNSLVPFFPSTDYEMKHNLMMPQDWKVFCTLYISWQISTKNHEIELSSARVEWRQQASMSIFLHKSWEHFDFTLFFLVRVWVRDGRKDDNFDMISWWSWDDPGAKTDCLVH